MYYEFKEPYYALIKAEGYQVHAEDPTVRKYVRVYEEYISELDGVTDMVKARVAKCRQLYEDEALHLFAKGLGDNVSFADAKRMFFKIPINSLVLVDSSLV